MCFGHQFTDDIQWIGIQPWQMRRGEIDFSERVGIGHNILKIKAFLCRRE